MEVAEIRRLNMEALIAMPQIGTATKLAKLAGTDPGYVSQLRYPERTKRTMGSELARMIEKGCDRPVGWMDNLHDAKEDRAGAKIVSLVPLILWKDIARWKSRRNHMTPNTPRFETTTPAKPSTFAVVVVDDVMEPELRRGATLVVEPGLSAKSGDYVVVCVAPDTDAMCRTLSVQGKHKLLVPVNKHYPVQHVDRNTRIIGVVLENSVRYR